MVIRADLSHNQAIQWYYWSPGPPSNLPPWYLLPLLYHIHAAVHSASNQSVCPRMHGWRKIWSLDADYHRRTTGIHGIYGLDGNEPFQYNLKYFTRSLIRRDVTSGVPWRPNIPTFSTVVYGNRQRLQTARVCKRYHLFQLCGYQ